MSKTRIIRQQIWAKLAEVARPDTRFHMNFAEVIPDFVGSAGFVAHMGMRPKFPFTWTELCHALRDWRSEGGEAVQYGGPDLKLGDLTVEVA